MIFGKHINRYYRKYLPILLLGIAALMAVDYFQLKVPQYYQMIVNGINDGFVELDGSKLPFDMDFLLGRICYPMLGVVLSLLVGRFLWRICFFGSAIRMEADLRGEMFNHCKDLSQQYYQVNKVGNLMSLFTNDLETIQDCFGSGILMLCDTLTLGIMAVYKMLRMNVFLSILSLIPMVFLMVISTIMGFYMEKKWEIRQEAFSSLSDFAQESFSGIAVIKAFVKEFSELMAFRKLNEFNEKANVDFVRLSMLLHIFVSLFVESVICVILGYGGYLVYQGTFNAGQLVEFIAYFNSVIWPVMAVSELIEMQSRGKASLKRVSELLDAQPDVVDGPDVLDVQTLKGDISFRNLTFRYPDGEFDVLKNVSLDIRAGESVGIIGRTGAGKTTLVDLILRTYNVPDGTLFLDGLDVNRLSIHAVRENAAYVPQDNFLFSDTIQNNICFAAGVTDAEAARRAAVLADVNENISEFSLGYETVLGERGVTVSGGQKQRISIARALMKNAPILILDDSVSAVDVSTEKTILDHLRSERQGKTTILIAHRISTIEKMDKIVLIDDGEIVAVGSHASLLESCAQYRDMVELQKLEGAREDGEVSANA